MSLSIQMGWVRQNPTDTRLCISPIEYDGLSEHNRTSTEESHDLFLLPAVKRKMPSGKNGQHECSGTSIKKLFFFRILIFEHEIEDPVDTITRFFSHTTQHDLSKNVTSKQTCPTNYAACAEGKSSDKQRVDICKS